MGTYGQIFTRKTRIQARGTRNGGRLMTSIGFDPREHKRLSNLAWQQKISLAELIRRLCAKPS